jgi:hypothetical protein
MLCEFHFHVLPYGTAVQQNRRENCIIRVTQLRSGQLPMATFNDALGLPEGVDLCLTLQHHLILCEPYILGAGGGETHLFGHGKDI